MKLHSRHTLPWSVLIYCSFMLTMLLTACATPGDGTTAIPTPTPTPAPALTTYPGQGYTVGYPKGWTYKQGNGQGAPTTTFIDNYISSFSAVAGQAGKEVSYTTFTDSLGVNTLTIGTLPNPNGTIPTQTALDGATTALQSAVKNYKKGPAPQTTVGGQTWDGTAATGNVTYEGATVDTKTVALVYNYPAQSPNTKLYFIVYAAPASTFDDAYTKGFQPILESYKFS